MNLFLLALVGAESLTATAAVDARSLAESLKLQGFVAFRRGDYQSAAEAFELAYQAIPHPNLLFNQAMSYRRWPGHCRESIAAFDRFLTDCGSCPERPLGERERAAAWASCRSHLAIESRPSAAAVWIEGTRTGTTPTSIERLPGTVEVRLEHQGYLAEVQQVELLEGANSVLRVVLRPETSPPQMVHPDQTAVSGEGDLGSVLGWSALALGALAASGGGVAAGLSLDALGREREVRAGTNPRVDEVSELRNEARDLAIARNGLWIGGLVFVVTGAVLLLNDELHL